MSGLFPLRFENISVINSPISKSLYCEYLNIKGLNDSFNVPCICRQKNFNHQMKIPHLGLRPYPTFILFHIRNITDKDVNFCFKRKKLCDCPVEESKVGINKFRMIHNCPHRWLICVTPKTLIIKAKELTKITFSVNYYKTLDDTKLQFEMRLNDDFQLDFIFDVGVVGFNPVKCILDMPLGPLDLCKYETIVQPIWIHNFNATKHCFKFISDEPRLQILTPMLCIEENSIKPILIKYRPKKEQTELRMLICFQSFTHPFVIQVNANYEPNLPIVKCFYSDLLTAKEMPIRIYKNTLFFNMTRNDSTVQMVAVHNDSEKCYRLQWVNYNQPGYFDVLIQPESCEIKRNHTILCLVNVKSYGNPCHFKHVHINLQIHRKLTKNEKIARKEVQEAESIDDINLYKDSLLMSTILDVNIEVNGHSKMQMMDLDDIKLISDDIIDVPSTPLTINRTIIESIFWKFIYGNKFTKESQNWRQRMATYEELFDCGTNIRNRVCKKSIAKDVFRILTSITLIGISKQWRFVPLDVANAQKLNDNVLV